MLTDHDETPRIEITGYDHDDLRTYMTLSKLNPKFFKISGLSGKYFVRDIVFETRPPDSLCHNLLWKVVLVRVIESETS